MTTGTLFQSRSSISGTMYDQYSDRPSSLLDITMVNLDIKCKGCGIFAVQMCTRPDGGDCRRRKRKVSFG